MPLLNRLLRTVAHQSDAISTALSRKLDKTATATNSQRLEGKTSQELLDSLSASQLGTTPFTRSLLDDVSAEQARETLGAAALTHPSIQGVKSVATLQVSHTVFTPIATVTGNSLTSSVQLNIKGTTDGIVLNTTAFLVVGHSHNIYIRSESTGYTPVEIKVDSNNGNFTVSIRVLSTESAGPTPCQIQMVAFNGEAIVLPDTQVRYNLTTHTHTSSRHAMNITAVGQMPFANLLLNGRAIIERGSNANGEYVRYADGTQICWHRLSIGALTLQVGQVSNVYGWTFPATFATAAVACQIANQSGWAYEYMAGFENVSATFLSSIYLKNVGANGRTQNHVLHLTAIGRWY